MAMRYSLLLRMNLRSLSLMIKVIITVLSLLFWLVPQLLGLISKVMAMMPNLFSHQKIFQDLKLSYCPLLILYLLRQAERVEKELKIAVRHNVTATLPYLMRPTNLDHQPLPSHRRALSLFMTKSFSSITFPKISCAFKDILLQDLLLMAI